MFITTPEYDEKDIETQAYLTPAGRRHNHATAGGILEADDGVPRRKGIFAPLWKAMAWFDRVNLPLSSGHGYISNMDLSLELKQEALREYPKMIGLIPAGKSYP